MAYIPVGKSLSWSISVKGFGNNESRVGPYSWRDERQILPVSNAHVGREGSRGGVECVLTNFRRIQVVLKSDSLLMSEAHKRPSWGDLKGDCLEAEEEIIIMNRGG